ncbi:MAG: hypothetical protein ACE5KT_03530 [Methanosarcinales archaeon]
MLLVCVLTDDKVAYRVAESVKKHFPAIKIMDTGDVFKLAFERFVVVLKSKEEMKNYICGFEKEARLKLSKDTKEDIFKAWETYQKELVIF